MIVTALAIALGVALGLANGGSVANLARARLRSETLLIALFVVQGLARARWPFGAVLPSSWALPVWISSSLALIVVLVMNRRLPGLLVAAVGVGLNVLVVSANGAMPAAVSGVTTLPPMYVPIDESTLLVWLADTFRIPDVGGPILVSLGDMLLWAGAGITAFSLVRRPT